jgi:diacylglycerol O-acyltransferase
MERLSGVDAAFLYMETPVQHMHGVGVTIFDPSDVPGGYDYEAARYEFGHRLLAQHGFRRRLVEFPLGVDHPVWVESRVDLDEHFVRASLPAPGNQEQFEKFVGEYSSVPLRRDRPLWEFCLLEGLEGGRIAMLSKIHHTIIDGVSGSQMMADMYDLAPVAIPFQESWPEVLGEDEPEPSLLELAAASITGRVGDPLRAVSVMTRTLVSLAEAVVGLGATDHMTLPVAAPATPFSHSLTSRRAVAFARASLTDVKEIKNSFAVTVNDVVLAACTMALRRRLLAMDALPDRALVASVPVSARREGEHAASYNRVSAMFVALPVHLEDPLEVLRSVSRDAATAKKMMASLGKDLLGDWVELLPPLLFAQAMQLYSSLQLADHFAPVHNLVISNVPGPPFPFFAAGARVVAVYPLGPILEGAGLNVTVFSYEDALDIGVVTCPDLVPEVDTLAEAIVDAIVELRSLAEAPEGRGAAPRPRAVFDAVAREAKPAIDEEHVKEALAEEREAEAVADGFLADAVAEGLLDVAEPERPVDRAEAEARIEEEALEEMLADAEADVRLEVPAAPEPAVDRPAGDPDEPPAGRRRRSPTSKSPARKRTPAARRS